VSRMHAGTNGPRRWKRYYNEDWVVDPQHKALPPAIAGDALRYKERCYKVLAYMFPSAGGLLTISTEVGDSLYKGLMSHPEMKGKGPRVLAALLAMALGARLEGSTAGVPSPRKKKWGTNILTIKHGDRLNISINTLGMPRLRNIIKFFADGVEYDCSDPSGEAFPLSKEVLLHAFMLNFLQNTSDVEDFIETFYDIAKDNPRMLNQCFAKEMGAGSEDGQAEAALYGLIMNSDALEPQKTLPFTPLSPPLPFTRAHFYNRKTGKFAPDTFSDCIEATLLSTLYCLFYDPASGKCRVDRCCEGLKGTALARFLEDYPDPGNAGEKMREEWLRVVEDPNNADIVCSESEKMAGYRGELCSGLINFLRTIVEITGLNAACYCREHNTHARGLDFCAVRLTLIGGAGSSVCDG